MLEALYYYKNLCSMFQVPEDAVHVSSGGIGFEFEVADENSLQMEQHMIDICQVERCFVQ